MLASVEAVYCVTAQCMVVAEFSCKADLLQDQRLKESASNSLFLLLLGPAHFLELPPGGQGLSIV